MRKDFKNEHEEKAGFTRYELTDDETYGYSVYSLDTPAAKRLSLLQIKFT